jgi:hypothetical protein
MKPNPRVSQLHLDSNPPRPPRDLGDAGSDLWKRIHKEYKIDDSGSLEVLAQACESASRAALLGAAIAEEGTVLRSGRVVRSHPSIKDELACRAFVVRTLERLGILHQPVNEKPGRQPVGVGAGIRFLQPPRGEE